MKTACLRCQHVLAVYEMPGPMCVDCDTYPVGFADAGAMCLQIVSEVRRDSQLAHDRGASGQFDEIARKIGELVK